MRALGAGDGAGLGKVEGRSQDRSGLWGGQTVCRTFQGHALPGARWGTGAALTDWELSLLLSRDLFFARRFFFLCRGLDSRIISSSSKVGSQCRRPFCGGAGAEPPRVAPATKTAIRATQEAYVGHKTRLHLLLTQVVPQHVGQRRGGLHVLEAGDTVLGVHSEELEQGPLSPGRGELPHPGPPAGTKGQASNLVGAATAKGTVWSEECGHAPAALGSGGTLC